jgi:hypothetical protein
MTLLISPSIGMVPVTHFSIFLSKPEARAHYSIVPIVERSSIFQSAMIFNIRCINCFDFLSIF